MKNLNQPHLVALAAAVFLLAFSITTAQLSSSIYGGQVAQASKSVSGLNDLLNPNNTTGATEGGSRGPILTRDNGCQSTPLPPGLVNQTVRCDGNYWVAASNLLNDGTNVGIGYFGIQLDTKLTVSTDTWAARAIYGNSISGSGVGGQSNNGTGVMGITHTGTAVLAQGGLPGSLALDVHGKARIADGTEGAGKVLTSGPDGLASWQAPSGSGSGGGSVWSGYEVVRDSTIGSSGAIAYCPLGKQVIGGGCHGGTHQPAGYLVDSYPFDNTGHGGDGRVGWQCGWSEVTPYDLVASALCATTD